MVSKYFNNQLTSTKGFDDLYPFESNFLNINGHNLHYIDQGRGKPIIMIHGNPTWSFYYRNPITSLSKTHRTIVLDHIGCGFSDKPDTQAYHYTLKSRVNDLDCLINHLDIKEKISLIVHDWGGMIGLAWAVDNIDRIDKIVITNTSGFLLPKDKRFPLRLWLIKYLGFFAIPAVLGLNVFAKAALYMASETRLPPKVKKGLIAPYNSWKNRIATLKFVQDIPISKKDDGFAIVDHVDKHLDQLDESQLLFLWGAKDFVFDLTFFNEFKRRFPNAQSKIFQDAGHYLFEDKPKETITLIKAFLNQ
ncbi:MAG: alpha/beta fold hydrolase [Pseudomonadota bacterium]